MIDKPKFLISEETADELAEAGVRIRGVEIAPRSHIERADMMAVMRWTDPPIMAGNIRSSCSRCGAVCQERPHAPKKPKRICNACIDDLAMTRH